MLAKSMSMDSAKRVSSGKESEHDSQLSIEPGVSAHVFGSCQIGEGCGTGKNSRAAEQRSSRQSGGRKGAGEHAESS